MAGCQSKRNLTVKDSHAATVQTTLSADETHVGNRETWSKILAICDSLNLSFTADSIKTPEGGMVYNPVITVNAVSPSVALESAMNETEADLLHVEAEQTETSQTDTDMTDCRDTVAVAKPMSLRWIFTAMVILILCYILLKRRKT